MQNVQYGCTALMGTNKVGKLKKDENGYYEVVLGALDTQNSVGATYPSAKARALFEDSGILMRRIKDGNLRGEMGHPKRQVGQSVQDYMMRCLTIEETLVAFHIKSIRLDDRLLKGPDGKYVVAIIGKILPSGPYGAVLAAQLDNPDENVCFSIRALTNDEFVRGQLHKHLRQIVTWDCVNEPGLWTAKKWHAPTLECFQGDTVVMTTDILKTIDRARTSGLVAMENLAISLESLLEDLGYKPNYETPVSSKW